MLVYDWLQGKVTPSQLVGITQDQFLQSYIFENQGHYSAALEQVLKGISKLKNNRLACAQYAIDRLSILAKRNRP